MSNSSIWFSGSGEPGADNTTDVAWSYLELLQLTDSGSLGRNLSSDCINEKNTDLFVSRQYLNVPLDIIVLFWTSVIILFGLSFLEKRKELNLGCCYGRPSLPQPMNFLIDPAYRLPYILVFIVLAADLAFSIIQSTYIPSWVRSNQYLSLLYKIVIVPVALVVTKGVKYCPLLICIQASHLFIGHCIGLFYSLLWFSFLLVEALNTFSSYACIKASQQDTFDYGFFVAITFFQTIPYLGIAFMVFLWYLYQVIIQIAALIRGHEKNLCSNKYHLSYVMKLFARNRTVPFVYGRMETYGLKAIQFFIPYQNKVRLPLPFICVIASMTGFLFRATITIVFLCKIIVFDLLNEVMQMFDLGIISNAFFEGLKVSLIAAPIISLIFCCLLMLRMTSFISNVLEETVRHGFKEEVPSYVRQLQQSWKYLGTQAGLIIGAYFVYYAVMYAVSMVVVVSVIIFKSVHSLIYTTIIILLVPLAWSRLVFLLQHFICKYIFLDNKDGKFLSIKNYKLFNWFSYALFIYNGFAGFISAILRIIKSLVVSLLLLIRLDQMAIPPGFLLTDSDHTLYLSYYYLYHCYNNSVVHTFLHLVKKQEYTYTRRSSLTHSYMIISDDLPGPRRRARNRWALAYTLLWNPSLRNDRRSGHVRANQVPDVI